MTRAGIGIAIGSLALLVIIVVSITGGFVFEVGPVRFSAHRVVPPLMLAVAALAAARFRNRDAFLNVARALPACVERYAASSAVVFAAAAAGVGIGYVVYSAAGSDSSAYVNQSRLFARGELAMPVPLATQVPWPDAEASFSPLGFKPGVHKGEIVPTYPPGFPLLMTLASVFAGESGPYIVAPLMGAIAVLSTFGLGVLLLRGANGAHTASAIGAALLATSPIFLFQAVAPMSDVPAAALWTLALFLGIGGRPLSAGVVSGVAVLTRPNLLPLALAVSAALWMAPGHTTSRRGYLVRLLLLCVGMSLGGIVLALIQWRLYGGPLTTGYGAIDDYFDIRNIPHNFRDYSVRLFTGEAPALVLTTIALAWIAFASRPALPTMPVAKPMRLAAVVAAIVLACYLPYGVFQDWSYLRFLLPALPLAFTIVGLLVVNASLRLSEHLRGPVLLLMMAVVCTTNVVIAARQGVFLRWYNESRYYAAGQYLDAVLPRNAVVVTSQESGSVLHYTGRAILRWDIVPDLDAAVDDLVRLGSHPVLVLEEWEEPLLRRRFSDSPIARLDWSPRALMGLPVLVRYFDPSDRGRPRGFPPDRVR